MASLVARQLDFTELDGNMKYRVEQFEILSDWQSTVVNLNPTLQPNDALVKKFREAFPVLVGKLLDREIASHTAPDKWGLSRIG